MNGVVLVTCAIVILAIAYRFYGKWLAKTWGIDPNALTPAHRLEDNGRGFAINVHSPQEFAAFKADYAKAGENSDAELFDKWMTFETYRKIKFHNDFE